MPEVRRGGWTIHYEELGPAEGRAVVVIAGMGEQIGSVEFPEAQCRMFADAGHRVVRLDNRDSGLSVPDTEPPLPDWDAIDAAARRGERPSVPYLLTDMADDVMAVLDDIGLTSAIFVGASMGSAIARWAAIRHPERADAVLSVMGASGAGRGDDGPQTGDDVMDRIMGMAVRRLRPDAIEYVVGMWRWLWGSGHPFEERWVRERVTASFDRSYRPEGIGRYVAATVPTGLWDEQRAVACPIVVMQGGEDPCCPPEHGRAIAERIPGAELWEVPTMGHVMHEVLWKPMTERLLELGTQGPPSVR